MKNSDNIFAFENKGMIVKIVYQQSTTQIVTSSACQHGEWAVLTPVFWQATIHEKKLEMGFKKLT